MTFELTILGINSALPTRNHYPAAQVLKMHERLFLIDCGEGTQVQMLRAGVKAPRLDAIFISHLHGDHVFGLFGLLSAMSMRGRKKELPVYAPAPMEAALRDHLRYFGSDMSFQVTVHHVDTDVPALIYENSTLSVHGIPLKHRVPSTGFLFREKTPQRNVRNPLIALHHLQVEDIVALKNGSDVTLPDGTVLNGKAATYAPRVPRAYAYCSDTMFSETVIEQVRGVDLLYHEATFLSDKIELARRSMHSTVADAATVALRANAGRLLIGHFSSHYANAEGLLQEALHIFPNTQAAEELQRYEIGKKRNRRRRRPH
ncbi:MAG: ribonuclease Z [Prevotellaceae bacterium]|jgi:ribonuclease Z|nr:ribonuclease Z [Prevotellaceae bacterium]